MAGGLGRKIPLDWDHVTKYHVNSKASLAPVNVEKTLVLPDQVVAVPHYDQGREGACVGYGCSWMMSILNPPYLYDARWLWTQAKTIDGFVHTDPDDGTTVKAACDILRQAGHVVWDPTTGDKAPDQMQGVGENRWATLVDEVRLAIALGVPVAIGVNWYHEFDNPEVLESPSGDSVDHWIGRGSLTTIRGGHCVCIFGASDRRQAVLVQNNWGTSYPQVWLPYSVLQRLIQEDGEATLVTDRLHPDECAWQAIEHPTTVGDTDHPQLTEKDPQAPKAIELGPEQTDPGA